MANDNDLLTQMLLASQPKRNKGAEVARALAMGLQGKPYTPAGAGGGGDLMSKLMFQRAFSEAYPSAVERQARQELQRKEEHQAQLARRMGAQGMGGAMPTVTEYKAVTKPDPYDSTIGITETRDRTMPQITQPGQPGAGLVAPETLGPEPPKTIVKQDAMGEYEEVDNPEWKFWNKKRETALAAETEVEKQMRGKQEKDILTANQDMLKARFAITDTMDRWFAMQERQYELTGTPPGPIQGLLLKVYGPTKTNEVYESFHGQLVEYAAAVGRIAVPGSRATRLINLFKTTAPTDFSTIESAGMNAGATFRSALEQDMSRAPWGYLPEYEDLSEDAARRKWNGLSKLDQLRALDRLEDIQRDFEEEFVNNFFDMVYERNPALLREDYREEAQKRRLQNEQPDIIPKTEQNPLGLEI